VADLVAWTPGGDLAIIDGHTGAIRQAVTTLELSGERDVAYDPWKNRALIFEGDDEAQGGEIAAYPLAAGPSGPTLGPRIHQAWTLDGDVRLLPSPLGTVVFEDRGGERWRVLWNGGAAGAPVPAPRPMSAWLTTGPGGGLTVHGLAYGPSSGELDDVHATVGSAAIAPAVVAPFGVGAATLPPSARLVPAPARGGALLLDVDGSFITVRGASGASLGSPALAPLGATGLRIESAIALFGGEIVLLLMSGTTELVALEIDQQLVVASVARVALPGQPAASTRFLSHALAVQGLSRVAAVTGAGITSIQIWKDLLGVHLLVDPIFAGTGLRGPMAALWAPPP
jgi:hypothetical protein